MLALQKSLPDPLFVTPGAPGSVILDSSKLGGRNLDVWPVAIKLQ